MNYIVEVSEKSEVHIKDSKVIIKSEKDLWKKSKRGGTWIFYV